MNARQTRYLYQKIAGSRKEPGGVCAGYFRTAAAARWYHAGVTGYIRRVKVPLDMPIQLFA